LDELIRVNTLARNSFIYLERFALIGSQGRVRFHWPAAHQPDQRYGHRSGQQSALM